MNDSLVLSLGHNSSAILIRGREVVGGYETERLTGTKSDSKFPELPILELKKRFGFRTPMDVYVSHWELFGDVSKMSAKHWNPKVVSEVSGGGHLFQTNEFFTHHDAHAWSAVSFAGSESEFPQTPSDSSYVFVMDGFGTFGEHMSFYRLIDGIPVLLERKFGFGHSLGLLYQYTTAFLGMKQNQDEYKLLAYEAHVEEFSAEVLSRLDEMCGSWSDYYCTALGAYMEPDKTDPLLNVGALPNTAAKVADMLSGVVKASTLSSPDERGRRILCAYFTQKVVEEVVKSFVYKYQPKNVVLVGGLFYNVKLNNLVASMVPGLTCIMPLAGDQGAGLGVYKAINSDFQFPGNLLWGHRDLSRKSFDSQDSREIGLAYFADEDAAFLEVRRQLSANGMVNLVRGAMEYGPRALCNTSTLAVPSPEVARKINHLNARTNEMPFAPVMTEAQAKGLLVDCDRIHKSLDFMICTREYKPGAEIGMMGAAHRFPRQNKYSARPQICRDPRMVEILEEYGPLINTSFNFHGVPIPFSDEQVRYSHVMERARSAEDVPVTVVVGGSEA
jgi:predicted NodU family carbamoyl transferase